MKPLISIVVPVYNVQEYVRRCLESLAKQTYDRIEIVVVDDGSTDESGKICDEFGKRDERFNTYHKKNGGLSDARNYGIKRARGGYICLVDGDDCVKKDFIEKMVNGALLGFSNEEMKGMYNDIWDFAELNEFQDQKLKNYSSGMQVRLAFSIAIRARGDILLLDEVLAVGDAAFQQKCNDYFDSLKDKKQTVILVTHSMENVRKFCNRAILIEKGKIIKEGSPDKVADAYLKLWQ